MSKAEPSKLDYMLVRKILRGMKYHGCCTPIGAVSARSVYAMYMGYKSQSDDRLECPTFSQWLTQILRESGNKSYDIVLYMAETVRDMLDVREDNDEDV